jgi:hypothetical protein
MNIKSFLAILICALPAGAAVQNDRLDLSGFLERAESSELVCQIPSTPGTISAQPTALDVEIAHLSDGQRKELRPVFDELKRLQRLDCARLHLCQLNASFIDVQVARDALTVKKQWMDETREAQENAPGLNALLIQSKELNSELLRAYNEIEQDQDRVLAATRAFDAELLSIQTIAG